MLAQSFDFQVRTVIRLLALFVVGVFLGLHFRSAPKRQHNKETPVCNLDHAESHTWTNPFLEGKNVRILDFTFDEGVVSNLFLTPAV